MEDIAAKQRKMQALEDMVRAGGVKGLKAKAELEAMRNQDKTEENRRAIKGAAAQRSAQKAVTRSASSGSFTGSTTSAEAIKARIQASLAQRMEVLQKKEQARAQEMAAMFDGAFQEEAEEEQQEVEDYSESNIELGEEVVAAEEQVAEEQQEDAPEMLEDVAVELQLDDDNATAAVEDDEAAVRAELARIKAEEEEAERQKQEEERRLEAERKRLKELKEQEDRVRREKEQALEQERIRREEAAAAEKKRQQAAAALEAARREAEAKVLTEKKRKEEQERIAAMEEAAAQAEREASEKAAKEDAEARAAPIRNFSAWNSASSAAELVELERQSLTYCFKPEEWLNAFKLARSQNQTDRVRSLLRIVLQGTLRAIEIGKYDLNTDSDPVPMELDVAAVQRSIAGAVLYAPNHTWPSKYEPVKGTAHFLQGDCLDVALWLKSTRGVNPVVLVSVDPSGSLRNFERGSCSQEEEIWRRTTYSAVAGATQFLPITDSGCRYIPSVQVIRQGESAGYAFSTSPVDMSFIAACSVPEPKQTGMLAKYSDEVTARIKQTARNIFGAALAHHHDAVVIPAFGCGFNKGSPSVIGPLFHDVLVAEFAKAFKHVTFAITNDENGPCNFEQFQKAYVGRAKALAQAKAERAAKKSGSKK